MRRVRSFWLSTLLLVLVASLLGCGTGRAAPELPQATTPPPTGRDASTVAREGGGPKALVRTFQDGQGRTIELRQGRGTGHRGDWGWAHVVDKHILGHWEDGGIVTTFPQALGTTSEAEVQDLIAQALRQSPRNSHGRHLYEYSVPGKGYRVTVVVGSDGRTIITAYPNRERRRRS